MASTPSSSKPKPDTEFEEPANGFEEDDLLSPTSGGDHSFLERDNFEEELGNGNFDDPFSESFADIARHQIVDVIAEGDLVARPIILIYAFRLPSNRDFDFNKFLRYLQYILDKVVDLDYSIVYLHYGLRSNNKPPVKWLIQVYQVLDRRYKKNLKALFLVHPSTLIRVIWNIFKPFISLKFERKVHYVNYLHELNSTIRIAQLNLPQVIIDHDLSLVSASKHQSFFNRNAGAESNQPLRPTQQFGAPLEFILEQNPDYMIPPIVVALLEFLRNHGMEVEGIFRRSAEVNAIQRLQERINMGRQIDWLTDPEYVDNIQKAVIHASVLLKTFLRSLGEPVITNKLYPRLVEIEDIKNNTDAIRGLIWTLPSPNFLLLKTIIQFLTEVAAHSHVNLMTPDNLGVVFGPNLTWPTDQQVPLTHIFHLNSFCTKLITDYGQIFEKA
uniref:Rho GTPase-activating protein 68F n=1 Tax=Panagrellus redivivus TaxID=6233 RepID=A0A7E4V4V0_PANRE